MKRYLKEVMQCNEIDEVVYVSFILIVRIIDFAILPFCYEKLSASQVDLGNLIAAVEGLYSSEVALWQSRVVSRDI